MTTFAEHDHPRTPSGVSDGGQFAGKVREEADVVLQAPDPQQHPAVLAARNVLAAATGLDVDAVDAEVSTGHVCCFPDGTAYVTIAAPVMDDPVAEGLALRMTILPNGTVRELTGSVTWEAPALPGSDPTDIYRDGIGTPSPRVDPTTDETALRELVGTLRRQARIQRALDETFNHPQAVANLTTRARRRDADSTHILRFQSLLDEHRFAVVVENRRNGREGYVDRLTLDLRPQDAHVEAITIDTCYGPVRSEVGQSPQTVDRVCGELNCEVSIALGEPSERWLRESEPLRERLAAALAKAQVHG